MSLSSSAAGKCGSRDYVAQALGIPPYTVTSFFASKYLVFRARRAQAENLDHEQV